MDSRGYRDCSPTVEIQMENKIEATTLLNPLLSKFENKIARLFLRAQDGAGDH